MKQIILFSSLVLFGISISAQSISRDVVSSSGDFYSNSTGMLSWTIGEPNSATYSNANYFLTEGFQQTKLEVTSLKENNIDLNVSVYPNPTHDYIQLDFTGKKGDYRIALYDTRGKLVEEINIDASVSNKLIDLSGQASGTYYLNIYSTSEKIKDTFKIQKLTY